MRASIAMVARISPPVQAVIVGEEGQDIKCTHSVKSFQFEFNS